MYSDRFHNKTADSVIQELSKKVKSSLKWRKNTDKIAVFFKVEYQTDFIDFQLLMVVKSPQKKIILDL